MTPPNGGLDKHVGFYMCMAPWSTYIYACMQFAHWE